jgi:hypothetical protein
MLAPEHPGTANRRVGRRLERSLAANKHLRDLTKSKEVRRRLLLKLELLANPDR